MIAWPYGRQAAEKAEQQNQKQDDTIDIVNL
jgi:hypothetical protein